MRVLCIGDIYMQKGMDALKKYLPSVKQQYRPNLIIANGENASFGNGLTQKTYKELMSLGVNVVTLGNHTFTKAEIVDFIDESNIVRPLNYGITDRGKGYLTINYNDQKVTIISLMGRVFMHDLLDNPFTKVDELLKTIESDYIIVDFHAEATSEKYAMAGFLDGRVDILYGTHTHVPTADNIVFPKGMMYISDIGMTGVKYGVIGGKMSQGIEKFITGIPQRVIPETDGPLQFNACLFDLTKKTVEKINIFE